jgi:hypothetical protein
MGVSPVQAISVLAQIAVIVRLWPLRAGYRAFLALMGYSVFLHGVSTVSDPRSLAYLQFWSISVFLLAALQVAASLELLRRWIGEYPKLRVQLLLNCGLVAFVAGGAFLANWPSPFRLFAAASVFEQAAGAGLALYLVLVCGLLRLLYPAVRPNLKKHSILFTLAMVASARATWVGSGANWWFIPTLIAIYVGYLTLTPAGEIPPARAAEESADAEQAFSALNAATQRLKSPESL